MVIIRDWCLKVCIHVTHYCACSDFIITTIIFWINFVCLLLCPWIAAVKHHVNDKDRMWRAAERNWLWITRTQRLQQWCSYQSLCVRLCPDSGLSSLTLLINIEMQQPSPSSFNPRNEMSHHWPHRSPNGCGGGLPSHLSPQHPPHFKQTRVLPRCKWTLSGLTEERNWGKGIFAAVFWAVAAIFYLCS